MRPTGAVTVTRFAPQQWLVYRALRLASLADAPDAFGAQLAQQQEWPDKLWQMRLEAGIFSADACPLLARCDGGPAGLIWGKLEAAHDPDGGSTEAHVYQVWVAPAYRGRAVGRALLDAVIDWARSKNAHAVNLSVALTASAATRLYRRAGFVPVGKPQLLRDSALLLTQPMQLLLHPSQQ
ncbi:GNAT family N-acetyltransferase [Massilia sp. S19_KUP03_FR1]|uniref:GNAT family N-acetyltransferase n=1 Tax=Massilia sp. S19_KUP03_FR1 TaxID=3025503 RepID=UPI002FCD8151